MEIDPDDPRGSMLNLKDSSLKRGWRKQRDEEQAEDTKCGLGRCKPDTLQCCGAMAAFTAVYSISGLITTALQSYVASQITALERHFGFTSSMTGFIVSSNEIGFLSVTILFSYFVRKMHIPRMLSASTFMYGVSGLMCVIPFLLTRDQVSTPSSDNFASVFQTGPLCALETIVATTPSSNLTETICKEKKFSYVQDPTMRKIALAIISSGMIIQGICKAPRSSGLATYVDDNVPKTKTPMYISIIFGCAICAAALAFGLGGVFSQTFITLEPTGLTPMHPRWVGAWWMGFLVFGVAAMFFSLPLMCFPRRMKKAPERHDKPIKISGFLAAVARLLTNPVYLPITLANCLVLFSLGGIMAFLPKYLETQFTMPSWKTNIILGGTSIVTNCAGTMVGGIVISKWKLTPLTCLKIGVVSVAFSVFLQTAAVFLGCPNPIISKGSNVVFKSRSSLNMTYGPETTTATAPINCNGDCGCNDDVYFPMCGADGTNYFNPCFAGCRKFNRTAYTYSDCACVTGSEKSAMPGLCDTDCPFFYPFIGMSVVGGLAMSATAMPIFISIIRSVSEEDKPVSLGMGGFLNTLLGFLPGPIFFGWLIDKACIHWNAGCGNTGSCALYDIELFRYFVMGVPAAVRVLTLILYVFALCMAKRPGSYYRKYEEEHGTQDETIKMNTKFRS